MISPQQPTDAPARSGKQASLQNQKPQDHTHTTSHNTQDELSHQEILRHDKNTSSIAALSTQSHREIPTEAIAKDCQESCHQ